MKQKREDTMNPDLERRMIPGMEAVEFRAEEDGPGKLRGSAAVFDRWSENLGGFIERIAPGAFAKALRSSDTTALFNHNPSAILGRQSAGTLKLEETKSALMYDVDLPDTTVGRDVAVSVERRDITGNSFAFMVKKDEWEQPSKDGDPIKRTILEVAELIDVGPVTYPAYPQTAVSKRENVVSQRCLDRVKEMEEERKEPEMTKEEQAKQTERIKRQMEASLSL